MKNTLKNNPRNVAATVTLVLAGVYVVGTIISMALVNEQKKWIPILKSQLEQHAMSADTSKAALVKSTNDVMNGNIPISAEAYAPLRTSIGRDLEAADAYMSTIMDTKKQVDRLFAAKDTVADWNLVGNLIKNKGNKAKLQKLAIARGSTKLDAQAVDAINKIAQGRILQALAFERGKQQAPGGTQGKPRSQLK